MKSPREAALDYARNLLNRDRPLTSGEAVVLHEHLKRHGLTMADVNGIPGPGERINAEGEIERTER